MQKMRAWLTKRFLSVKEQFWKTFDKKVAQIAVGAIFFLVGGLVLFGARGELGSPISLPLWLVLTLSIALVASLVSHVFGWVQARREKGSSSSSSPQAEISVKQLGGVVFFVRKWLLAEDKLSAKWESRYRSFISNPLCSRGSCRAELIVTASYNTELLRHECSRCGRSLPDNIKSEFEIPDLKRWLFLELQRVHRTGVDLRNGYELEPSVKEGVGNGGR